jgi:hypothetical protein
MRSGTAVGGIAAIVYGLAGVVWTALQLAQPGAGFDDTDSPAVSLEYLRGHLENYLQQGLVLFVMAIALLIVVLAVWDLVAPRSNSLGLRTVSAMGLAAALSYFLFGVLRYGIRPLLHIDGLDSSWGEAAYLVQQIAGVHGFAPASLLTSAGWAVGIAVLGFRSRSLPRWLLVLAILPAIRLLTAVGPLLPTDALPGEAWVLSMVAIPGTMIWFVLLGVALLRQGPSAVRPAAVGAVVAPG